MESPLALGGAEEQSGSGESGWTIYIGSTIPNENDKGRDIHDDDDDDDDGGGSEDSMASDASSGPSHHDQLLPCGKGEGSSGNMGHIMKHAQDEGNSKYSSEKKPRKQVKKKDETRVKEEKGQSVYRAESAASQVSISGAKQRKTKMMLKQD